MKGKIKTEKQKVLISGATGFLGKKLMKVFADEGFEVVGTASEKKGKILKMDITDADEVMDMIVAEKPAVVVHAAATTRVDWCEDNKEEAFRINVDGSVNVANACRKIGAKMVYISTDYVFDGTKKGKYVETDKRNPIGVYAQSKAAAEVAIEKILENHLIARVTVLYGYNDDEDRQTFVTHVINTLREGKEFVGFTDQENCPTYIDDIAGALVQLVRKDEKGIFHLTGAENLSRHAFTMKIAKVFGFDQKLIKKGSWDSSGHKAPRAKFLDDSIAKLESKGIRMSTIEEGLKKMKKQMEKANSKLLKKLKT
jgi:dTDP-4-dehydrorhamnose reductase